jgi:hypothetical protein
VGGQQPKNRKRQPHRGQDRERKARDETSLLPMGLWTDVREHYPADVRAVVDGMVTRGASVVDVVALAVARHMLTCRRIEELWAERAKAREDGDGEERDHEAPGVRSVQLLETVSARYLSIAQAGVRDLHAPLAADGALVELPPGMTRDELVRRVRGDHNIIN